MNISLENVDPTWFLGLFAGGNLAGFWWLKRDTRMVNKAVNHVEVGTPTLSERMDIANQTIEYVQAQQNTHKKETEVRFDQIETKQNEIRGLIGNVQDDVAKIRESVDRRKIKRVED